MKFDIQGMIEQAQKVQSEIGIIKEELSRKVIEAESGGGMVRVMMTCAMKLVSINISEDLFKENDKQMIEDLVVAAVNKAHDKANAESETAMGKLGGMMPNMPGLNL